MKKIFTLSAVATIALLAGCDGSAPAKKPVEQNKNAPAAGSIVSGEQAMKDKLKSADAGTAGSAGTSKPKGK